MAGPLAAVERFFERMFERPAARLFQARLEPVHIQRGLERAMEADRRTHARRAYAPTSYRVLLNEADLGALDGDRSLLVRDVCEALRVYARSRGYVLLARPRVEIEPSSAVPAGDVRVYAEPVVIPEPLLREAPPPTAGVFGAGERLPDAGHEAPDDIGQATSAYATPLTDAPRAQLAVRAPGQATTRVPVRPGTVRVGRALDNDVVLADDKVSRHHGQFGVRLGMLVYTDLGSTNGSYLNGSPVTEIALGPGDVLQLGGSTVTIEPAP